MSDLDLAETQANFLSTAGQLLAVVGPTFGGTFFGAIATVFAIGAVNYSNNLRREIDLERYLRNTTTPRPTIPTTLDPSRCWAVGYDLLGNDIAGNPRTGIASALACSQLCAADTTPCLAFVYQASTGKCWIKSSYSASYSVLAGFTSGPVPC